MTRVLLVDDHRVVVQGIHAILDREADVEVVGEATSGEEALQSIDGLGVDVVLTDVTLKGINGVQLTRAIKSRHPGIRVLALTMLSDEECVASMIQAGADGYVLKSVSAADLINAIRVVAQGQVLYPAMAKKLLTREIGLPAKSHPSDILTDREREILRLIATGATSREIARQLFLSSKTVDNHRARILEKLQVRNKAEAVAHAIRGGYIAAESVEHAAPLVKLVPSASAQSRDGRANGHRKSVPFAGTKRYNGNGAEPSGSPRDSLPGTAGSEAI